MKETVENLRRKPSRMLTLTEIQDMKLIPWARDGRTIRRLIELDYRHANYLESHIRGKGTQRRYWVSSHGLINYLKVYGPVMDKHTKRYGRRKSKDRRSAKN